MLAPQMTDARPTSRAACVRSNRQWARLEMPVTHSNETIGALSNPHQIEEFKFRISVQSSASIVSADLPSFPFSLFPFLFSMGDLHEPVSNRQLPKTEDPLSHSKQTAAHRSNRQLFAGWICPAPPSANSKASAKLLPFPFSLFYFARPIFLSPFSGLSARIMAIPYMTSEALNGLPEARTRAIESDASWLAHREEDLPWD